MKVTKTSVHRLTIEKGCGCKATREYEDLRYTKPINEAEFAACEKHDKSKVVAEVIGEMLIESLEQAAETAKATTTLVTRPVPEGSGGVQATTEAGGSAQNMGMTMPPKIRPKRDPLEPKTASYERPNLRLPQNTSLNVARPEQVSDEDIEESGITITGDISDVPADPNIEAAIAGDLAQLESVLDSDEA
jgi:hypothetical protein